MTQPSAAAKKALEAKNAKIKAQTEGLLREYGQLSIQEENMKQSLNNIVNRKNQIRAEMNKPSDIEEDPK